MFQRITGWAGTHRCGIADTDCDGLDELLLCFYPTFEVWEWCEAKSAFVQGCTWDASVSGTFVYFHRCDLNQDGLQVFSEDFCSTPDSGLISWWSLDEISGTVATDVWGNNDGIRVGDPTPVAGYVSGGLLLDGMDDEVRVPDADSLDVGVGDFTLEAWVNSTSGLPVNPISSKYDAALDHGWAYWISNGNALGLALGDGSASIYLSSEAITITDGMWHHLAVAVNRDEGDGISFYLDASRIGTADPTGHTASLSNDSLFLQTRSRFRGNPLHLPRVGSRQMPARHKLQLPPSGGH